MNDTFQEGLSRLYEAIEKCGNTVLHVPIISMRSYETNLYDLACDGNFNRLVSVWLNIIEESKKRNNSDETPFKIYVVLPSIHMMTERSFELVQEIEMASGGPLRFLLTSEFPSGGPKQERSLVSVLGLCVEIEEIIREHIPGLVIYEPEYVGVALEAFKKINNTCKTMFWCPVSETDSCHPDFLEGVKSIDIELARTCDYLMVVTENQKKYFERMCPSREEGFVILNPMLIDPSLSVFAFKPDEEISSTIDLYSKIGFNIVYFPFRMTDPGYKFQEVMNILMDIATKDKYKIMLLYTDPNDSGEIERYLSDYKFLKTEDVRIEVRKVKRDRDTYYTCISDKRCIIPYLENVDNIMHASWQEMQYYGSTVVSSNVSSLPAIEKELRDKMTKSLGE